MKLTLLMRELFPDIAPCETEICAVTERSDLAKENTLFVCIRGALKDGHDFAAEVYAKGCRAFVAETKLSLPADALVWYVPNTRAALARLVCRFYGHPSDSMRLIGITGTKGKTITAHMIAHILNAAQIPCGYVGTNGITYGTAHLPTSNTTPDTVTLQKVFCDMQKAGVSTAVVEVSSQALMQYRVDGIRFETVLFTNLSPDHISTREHPDFDHYKACKKRLFTDFRSSYMVSFADDPAAKEMQSGTCAREKCTCSASDPTADYVASNIALLRTSDALGVTFTLTHRGQHYGVSLPLLGKVNVYNALLALAVANRVFKIPLPRAIEALSNLRVAGRSELIPLPAGACAVIDYAHNGVSMTQLLSTLREYRPSRIITLFGSIGERAQMRRGELGRAAAEWSDLCILTSDNPATEDPDAIIEEIAAAFAHSKTPYCKIADRKEAIEHAVTLLTPGDMLVLAGKGHEDYQLIETEKLPFCEREILIQAIKNAHGLLAEKR